VFNDSIQVSDNIPWTAFHDVVFQKALVYVYLTISDGI